MNTKTILILLLLIGILAEVSACHAYDKKAIQEGPNATMPQLLQDEVHSGKRIIKVVGLKESEVRKAIEDFIALNQQHGSIIDSPYLHHEADNFVIECPDGIDYDLFCYWVNYIVYSNKEQRYNENVTGWYEVSNHAKGSWEPFAGQTLMFFVPDSDTEYDNVFFMTDDNRCYKQEFAYDAPLIPVNVSPKYVYRKMKL